jgi:hypothetical protein
VLAFSVLIAALCLYALASIWRAAASWAGADARG